MTTAKSDPIADAVKEAEAKAKADAEKAAKADAEKSAKAEASKAEAPEKAADAVSAGGPLDRSEFESAVQAEVEKRLASLDAIHTPIASPDYYAMHTVSQEDAYAAQVIEYLPKLPNGWTAKPASVGGTSRIEFSFSKPGFAPRTMFVGTPFQAVEPDVAAMEAYGHLKAAI